MAKTDGKKDAKEGSAKEASNGKKPKPKIGFFDLSGCNGCLLSVAFNEEELLDMAELIDIQSFRFIKGKRGEKYDIVFMEGLVADTADLDLLKEVRENTPILVALGTCAHTGCIPAYRNFVNPSKYANMVYDRRKDMKDLPPTPISDYVKVDFTVPGCPPDRKQIKEFVKDLLLGKKPADYDKPVCFECRLNENRCLLIHDGKPCLGPITRGGCNSICTNSGWECWGCRGLTPDANKEVMIKLLQEKGLKKGAIERRMKSFVGLQLERPARQRQPKPLSLKRFKKKEEKKPAKKAIRKLKGARKEAKPVKTKKKAAKKTAAGKKQSKKKKAAKKPTGNKKATVKKKKTVKNMSGKKTAKANPKNKVPKKLTKSRMVKNKMKKEKTKGLAKKAVKKKQLKKMQDRRPAAKRSAVKKTVPKTMNVPAKAVQEPVKTSLFSKLKKKLKN